MRIVVVEDGPKIRRGIVNLIQKISPSYQVVGEAANGRDGIRVMGDTRPDLVIVDIRMLEMSGLEMLQRLKEQGLRHKAVILSAYSDFSFAQQAITLGVSEYLLKPVSAEKLQRALAAIDRELGEESQKDQSSRFLTLKNIFQDLLLGKAGGGQELQRYSNGESGFDCSRPFVLIGACSGPPADGPAGERDRNRAREQAGLRQAFHELFTRQSRFQFLLFDVEIAGLTLLVLTGRDPAAVAAFLESELRLEIGRYALPDLALGWVAVQYPEELHSKLQQLRELFRWTLIFGTGEILTPAKVARCATKPLVYPDDLEKQAMTAVSRNLYGDLLNIGAEFSAWWTREPYPPEQIIGSFVRFIAMLTNLIKETDPELFKQVRQQELMQQVLNAFTMEQLKTALNDLMLRLMRSRAASRSNYGLIVSKALRLLEEHYHLGITREELAAKLHITPEYLSMLFDKEVGRSFTAYLKNYRINKAKELLTHTGMKIYEVAEAVGYADPKYFCRVFKEVTGIPAGEYQKCFSKSGG
jgi:two-component system response regulator YesN